MVPGAIYICCVSRAKINFEGRKIDESWSFGLFFLIFWFFWFFMILRCSGYQFRLPGLISCPGQLPNRPGIEFQANSDFRVHIEFMCRFCKSESSGATASWNLAPRPNWSFHMLVSMSEASLRFEWSAAERKPKQCQKYQILLAKRGLGAQGGFVKLAVQRRRITL